MKSSDIHCPGPAAHPPGARSDLADFASTEIWYGAGIPVMNGEESGAADREPDSASGEHGTNPGHSVSGACDGLAAVLSISASIPRIVDALRNSDGLKPGSRANLVWLAKSFLSFLAGTAGDCWASAVPQMADDWCAGRFVRNDGRAPGTSRASVKIRRSGARAALRIAVDVGFVDSASLIAAWARPRPGAVGDAGSDRDSRFIEHAIADWWPVRWLAPAAEGELAALLPAVRSWVAKSEPRSRHEAVSAMRYTAAIALWSHAELGSADADIALHPRNVEHWTMRVNAHQSRGWRNQARGMLRRVGRAAAPGSWPPRPEAVGACRAAEPYESREECAFRLAAAAPGRKHRCEQLWLVSATLGAGLSGREAAASGPRDLVWLDAGRIAIRVAGTRSRIALVRDQYTSLAREASELCDGEHFFTDKHCRTPSEIAALINVQRLGTLSLRRARSTFVCAHLAASTPLGALRKLIGPITDDYLTQLLNLTADRIDAMTAVSMAMAA